jgi:glycosyltransferase involved in cell wall biosynthesis
MKILLVHTTYQQPGGEDVVFEQEHRLLQRAAHTVVRFQRSNCDAERYSGLARINLAARTIWSEESKRQLAEVLRREQPNLVHVHNTFMMLSPSIYSACQEAGVPVVQTLHNYRLYCPASTFFRDGHACEDCVDKGLWHGVAHGCYRGSRAATAVVALGITAHRKRETWTREVACYIALTEFARSRFTRAGLPPEKIFVKSNFVDPDPGVRRDSKGEYALFVGRLAEERIRVLLNAWSLLSAPRLPLVIIGGGPLLEQYKDECKRRGLEEIIFRGAQPRDEVFSAMHGARFLVFPSEWYENFPVTIAESFACGVPVVCSRIGAMQEIVDDGRTGLHFASGDAANLAEKVRLAWDHPEQMSLLGEEARCEYEAKYTAEKNYPILANIYEEAMRLHCSTPELAVR